MSIEALTKEKARPVKSINSPIVPPGEPWVWFCGMGLSAGLLMIIVLLAVIAFNGLNVFWPKQVIEFSLHKGSVATLQNSQILSGQITKSLKDEYQLFVGNKHQYGLAFRYVKHDDIQGDFVPRDVAVMERMEYGNAIGYPVKILYPDGSSIEVSNKDFDHALEEVIHTTHNRSKLIKKIERDQIGKINAKMQSLLLDKKGLTSQKKLDQINQKLDLLQADYEILAKRAKDLRAQQHETAMTYRLPTGKLNTIPAGQLLDIIYPNRMTLINKISYFFEKIFKFLSEDPREANTEGGIFPAIFGTFVMTLLMSIAVTPFGIVAAIYLREYAKQGPLVRSVRIAVNNLAGVPSIVFGVFGLGFFVYFVGASLDEMFFHKSLPTPTFGTGGLLWASLTLALMTVPVVIVSTEEALASVPRGAREGSLACGASKWQTIYRVVLPASAPGIMTGFILAMARGAGEVAPLMLVGVVKLAPTLPLDTIFPFIHMERKFMHLGFHIYDLGFQSPDSEAAKPMVFATTLVLIALVIMLNITAIVIRQRLKKKYAIGAV